MPETNTSTTYQSPVDTLILRGNGHGQSSLLDTIFVSRQSRRAVYATTTRGPETSLWRVASNGALRQVAQINWEHQMHSGNAGDGSLMRFSSSGKRAEMVSFAGKMIKSEDFLRKGRGWFTSDSRLTTIGDAEYKWKSGAEDIGTKDGNMKNQKNSYHDIWKIWRCIGTNASSSNQGLTLASENANERDTQASTSANTSHPPNNLYQSTSSTPLPPLPSFVSLESLEVQGFSSNEASIRTAISLILTTPAPLNLLARFAPPQGGLPRSEITLFPPILKSPDPSNTLYVLEHLLLTIILLATVKGEWKRIQSENDSTSLQAILGAEAVGDVPPYTPSFGRTVARGPEYPFEERRRRNRALLGPSEQLITRSPGTDLPEGYDVDYSDQVPLLGHSSHRVTRSMPQSRFTASRRGSRNASTQPSSFAPPTAGNPGRAGDGIFASPRRSLQNSRPSSSSIQRVPLGERYLNDGEVRTGIERGTVSRRPMTSPPPGYKQ